MKRIKIAVAALNQETNSFSPLLTDLSNFQRGYYYKGRDITDNLRHTGTEVGGFIRVLEEEKSEILAICCTWSLPAGPVKRETMDYLLDCITNREKLEGADGMLLSIHGAMAAVGEDNVEGVLLTRLKAIIPESTPVVCALDMHANITEKVFSLADILVGYRTYPHEDLYETGVRAAGLVHDVLKNKRTVKKLWVKLPMIISVESACTDRGIMKEVMNLLRKLENNPSVLSCSLFMPHPWLDVGEFTTSLVCYTLPENDAVKEKLDRVAEKIWDNRFSFQSNLVPFEEAEHATDDARSGPVVWIDSGDIVLAGAPGDSNYILERLLQARSRFYSRKQYLLAIHDPDAVSRLLNRRAGDEVLVDLGGKFSTKFFRPLPVKARIGSIERKDYAYRGSFMTGLPVKTGVRVVLHVKNVTVVLTQYPDPAHDPEFFRSLGIDLRRYSSVVVKSHNTFKPAYEAETSGFIHMDTPGVTTSNLKRLVYLRLPRPIFPLDDFML